MGCLKEVLRKIKTKLLLILYVERSTSLYIYIYVLENFTKRFDQVILMYKIGNTRIEFQTSSRIKLQLVGSINESRSFTSLSEETEGNRIRRES